jgi:hypothetical protein
MEEYGIQGDKTLQPMHYPALPTEELFVLDEDTTFPLNLSLIAEKQQSDNKFTTALAQQPTKYEEIEREGVKILCLNFYSGITLHCNTQEQNACRQPYRRTFIGPVSMLQLSLSYAPVIFVKHANLS